MLGGKSESQSHVVRIASSNVTGVYCFIHRLGFFTKLLPPKLLSCLNHIITTINFDKTSALSGRLFELICENLAFDRTCILYDRKCAGFPGGIR